MHNTKQFPEQQQARQLHNTTAQFVSDFTIGTLLNKCGMRKLRGASPLEVFTVIFMLPFNGVNFSRGIINNQKLSFKKDAAYAFLENPKYNWRKFMLELSAVVARFFDVLTSEQREKVLIFDDSTYDRSRSKKVELLSWIFDHNSGRHLKGFKLLTLGWSDGTSFLPMDFVLCASTKTSKRVQGISKDVDKRCCGYKRRQDAITKSTEHLETMIKRVLAKGIRADYLLLDSWFCFPALLATLGTHLPLICMAKNMPKVFYRYKGKWLTLGRLFSQIKKRPGRAKILASVVVQTKHKQAVKIVFVRHRHSRKWLAVMSTKIDLPDEEIIRIYGKRWDIEVFFKMMKHYLNLERETQLRDFDGIIGHITIAMSRYIFLSYEQRCHDDPRTLGSLFFACCGEMKDLDLLEAMQRILTLAMEKVRTAGVIAEDIVLLMVDAIMSTAVEMIESSRRQVRINNRI